MVIDVCNVHQKRNVEYMSVHMWAVFSLGLKVSLFQNRIYLVYQKAISKKPNILLIINRYVSLYIVHL